MNTDKAELKILINYWTFWDQMNGPSKWSIDRMIETTAEAGFDAFTCPSDTPELKSKLAAHGLRFGAAFQAFDKEQLKAEIERGAKVDSGPMNCQLGEHDTSFETAVELTVALMDLANENGVRVHLETHRGTCTETPEKTISIVKECYRRRGRLPLINYDFSHFASFKHLEPKDYVDRLIEVNKGHFQLSNLWHMRPFNGHHCQVPVTDGQGNFSPEYLEVRPFVREAIQTWLDGPQPTKTLWICPELGPFPGYGLSCFPDRWSDTKALANDIKDIWAELNSPLCASR